MSTLHGLGPSLLWSPHLISTPGPHTPARPLLSHPVPGHSHPAWFPDLAASSEAWHQGCPKEDCEPG